MKCHTATISAAIAVAFGTTATAKSEDPLSALFNNSPVIVAVGILELTPGVLISDNSLEFTVRAKVGHVAKGDLKPNGEIKVVIRLPIREYHLLGDNPFGMKQGGDSIMFLRPQFAADGKTFIHYRFSEMPLGCLAYNPYTWEQIKRETEKSSQEATRSAKIGAVEQRLDPNSILGKWTRIDPSENIPRLAHHIDWMHFLPNNKVEWSFKSSPSRTVVRRGSYNLALSGNLAHHSTKRVLLRIDPTAYSPATGGVREDGTPIFLMDLQVGKGIDCRFPYEETLLKFRTEVSDFAFRKDNSEDTPSGGDKPSN